VQSDKVEALIKENPEALTLCSASTVFFFLAFSLSPITLSREAVTPGNPLIELVVPQIAKHGFFSCEHHKLLRIWV
jgi:hypothetical protein